MGATIVPGTGSRRAYFPKYKINQGPFSGGLNTVEDPTSLGENELQECVNFVAKPDGVLYGRAPVGISTVGLPTITGNMYVTALGSVIQRTTGDLIPIIAITDLTSGTDFYRWTGTTWVTAFAHHAQTEGTSPTGSTGVFTKIWLYNNVYYLLTTSAGIYSTTGLGTALTYIGPQTINGKTVAGVDGAILKNRLIISDGENLFWSKATDPTNWVATGGAPPAGVLLTNSSDGDQIRSIIVFQDDLWVMKNNGVYRWSWSTDPNLDGTYEQISTDGAFDCAVYNSDLYIINGNGVYKLVSSFFTEVSAKIRSTFRTASSQLDYNGVFSNTTLLNKIGLFKIGSYLMCGPFNTLSIPRPGDPDVDDFVGNSYYILDLDTGVWVEWQFSAYSTTNPVSGPVQDVMPFSQNNPAAPDSYLWIGASKLGVGSFLFPYLTQPYSINAAQLEGTNVGQDKGTLGSSWIGGRLKLGSISLGDATAWKRVFTSTLDAVWTSNTLFSAGASTLGYVIDGVVSTVRATVSAQRLNFGKAFRCKSYAMYYDSITSVAVGVNTNQLAELTDINAFFSWVQISRKDTDTGSS